MPEAVIKVGSKKPPEPGKKRWKIISFQNEVFQINSELSPLFTEGKTYKVFYENREFQGRHFKEIPGAPEQVPEISTGTPQSEPPTYSRPRAAKEDEEGVNRRHRLNWIGERLDVFGAGKPTTYESLRPVVGILGELYDTVAEGDKEETPDEGFPAGTIRAAAQRAKANAYKPGVPASVDPDLDDDIPFN